MCLVSRRRGWDADRKKEKEKKRRQKLNFRPPDTSPRTIPVCHKDMEKSGDSYIMTLDAGFSSYGGGGLE